MAAIKMDIIAAMRNYIDKIINDAALAGGLRAHTYSIGSILILY
jgi:hypothetical protein